MSIEIKKHGLSTFALVMLITGAIDSIRNLPSAALFGSSLIFFFVFSALIFLIPAALVSAELASAWTEEEGIYHWVRIACGEKIGFLAIWLQWISNLVWFPTMLSFVASTAAYLINPDLAQNKVYLISIILLVFWGLTLLNLKGIHVSARLASVFTITGLFIPMALIIILALIWMVLGKPLQIHFTFANMIPNLKTTHNWMSLTAIMTAFLGMELAAVHIRDVKKPQRTFPKALIFSTIIILITMIMGSLAIAIVLPKEQINLVSGVMLAFSNFFASYHLAWMMPLITLMILLGSLGGIISWVISPAKGLLQAAKSGYLPEFFQKENKYGVATNLLLIQAVIVSGVCLAYLFMPSVNASYWLLTALSTQLYILMYVILFITALVMRYKFPKQPRPFAIPGKKGMWCTSILGLVGCAITLLVGFFPPEGINVGSTLHYEIIFAAGIFCMLFPIFFFISFKNKITSLFAT